MSKFLNRVACVFISLLIFIPSLLAQIDHGLVRGSFSVGSSGAANYIIPIEVPPGMNGLQPNLGLAYNSQAGNGLLGVGWGLVGIPAITRCPKTLAQDGKIEKVKLKNSVRYSDSLCLGGQKLIAVNGDYGADGTEYRTEVDSFQKIISHSARRYPLSFTVYRRDGSVIEYGGLDANNAIQKVVQYYNSYGSTGWTRHYYSWSIREVRDSSGNRMTYHYRDTEDERQILIDSINYFYVNGVAEQSVRFVYSQDTNSAIQTERPDIMSGYMAGAKLSTTKLLTNVQTQSNGNLVRDYRLSYGSVSPSTGRSRLVKVDECDALGICKIPLNSSWQNTGTGINPSVLKLSTFGYSAGGWRVKNHPRMMADVDGDGMADIVGFSNGGVEISLATGNGNFAASVRKLTEFGYNAGGWRVDKHPRMMADVNGDGMADIVGFADAGVRISLATGNGNFAASVLKLSTFGYSAGGWRVDKHPRMVVDVDGDGMADIVGFSDGGVEVSLATGGGNFAASVRKVNNYGYNQGWRVGTHLRVMKDINGDGMTDIVGFKGDNIYPSIAVSTSTGGVLFSEKSGIYGSDLIKTGWVSKYPRMMADVNGDGLLDIVGFGNEGVRVALAVDSVYATDFFNPSTLVIADFGYDQGWRVVDHPRMMADINGDGMADIIGFASDGMYFSLALGDGTFAAKRFGGSNYGYDQGWRVADHPRMMVDVNGDGIADIVGFGKDGVNISTAVSSADRVVKLDANIYTTTSYWHRHGWWSFRHPHYTTTSTGYPVINISYKLLTDDSIYRKDYTSVTYPYRYVRGAIPLVSEIITGDGIGGTHTNTYRYRGGKLHQRGRGFLGFSAIDVTTTSSGSSEISKELTGFKSMPQVDFAQNGKVYLLRKHENGIRISLVQSEWLTGTSDQSLPFPYLNTESIYVYKANGRIVGKGVTTINPSDIDSYGNVTKTQLDSYKIATNGFVLEKYTTIIEKDYDPADLWKGLLVNETVSRSNGSYGAQVEVSETDYSYVPGSSKIESITREPNALAGSNLRLVKTYGYDPTYGYQSSETISGDGIDGLRITTTDIDYSGTASGRYIITNTNAEGHVSEVQVELVTGNVASSLDVNGAVGSCGYTNCWDYDNFGRKTKVTRSNGNQSFWNWYSCAGDGLCNKVTGAPKEFNYTHQSGDGQATVYRFFDQQGRLVRTSTDGLVDSIETRTAYNALGQVKGKTNKYFVGDTPVWSCFEYDLLSKPIRQTLPSSSECNNIGSLATLSETTFDGLHTSQTVYNEGVARTSQRWQNAIGQLIKVTDTDNQSSYYSYNYVTYQTGMTGEEIRATDANDNVVITQKDKRGRKVSMDDPDMGVWDYTYSADNELLSQTDAKNKKVKMGYDKLGRKISRTDPGYNNVTASWSYDNCANGVGKLCSTQDSRTGFERSYSYDNLGRITGSNSLIKSPVDTSAVNYSISQTYTANGQLDVRTYPSSFGESFQTKNCYDSRGYLLSVRSAGSCGGGTVYWEGTDRDANGRVTTQVLGNGVVTNRVFEGLFGRIESIQSTQGSYLIQDSAYGFDTLGNLTSREFASSNGSRDVFETFTYDAMNRLNTADSSAYNQMKSYDYDAIGNITYKSDFGDYYEYDPARPHAVKTVRMGGANGTIKSRYSYDANGFMTYKSANSQSLAPTWFGKANMVFSQGGLTMFGYDSGHNRIWQHDYGKATTIYLNPSAHSGGHYERETKDGIETHKYYIYGGSGMVAVHEKTSSGNSLKYFLKDHLGSTEVVTNASGSVIERLSYDAFGKRRQTSGADAITPIQAMNTHHGFTGHEHIASQDFIHMNGRLYDPDLGRFMSADPIVAYPTSTQGFNRYIYTGNNPLSRVDLNGYFSLSLPNVGTFLDKTLDKIVDQFSDHRKGLHRRNLIIVVVVVIALLAGDDCWECAVGAGVGAQQGEKAYRQAKDAGLSSKDARKYGLIVGIGRGLRAYSIANLPNTISGIMASENAVFAVLEVAAERYLARKALEEANRLLVRWGVNENWTYVINLVASHYVGKAIRALGGAISDALAGDPNEIVTIGTCTGTVAGCTAALNGGMLVDASDAIDAAQCSKICGQAAGRRLDRLGDLFTDAMRGADGVSPGLRNDAVTRAWLQAGYSVLYSDVWVPQVHAAENFCIVQTCYGGGNGPGNPAVGTVIRD